MKRVLLLTNTERTLQTQRCIQHLREGLGADFELREQCTGDRGWVLGRYSDVRRAAKDANLIHAWGARPLRLAVIGSDKPIIYTPLADDRPSTAAWLRAATSRKRIHVVSLSCGEDRLCIGMGVPAEACHLVRPGVRMPKSLQQDAMLRKRLGIAPEHKVVLAVGDSYRHSNHTLAVQAATVLNLMDPRFRFLFTGIGPAAESVHHLHATWKVNTLIDASAILKRRVSFEELIPAADLAIVTAPDRLEVSPILTCMAGGLPLVAPATRPVSEILENRHTALLYSPTTARLAAQHLLMLVEQPELTKRLVDQARAEAYELFGVSRFLDKMRKLYGEAA